MDCSRPRTNDPGVWLETCSDFSRPMAEQVVEWFLTWEPNLIESIKLNMLCSSGRKLVTHRHFVHHRGGCSKAMNHDPSTEAEPSVAVRIHPSQFPAAIEAALSRSLRTRRMNHKFHYDTPRQALQWLRVHEAFSPARQDPSCQTAYQQAAAAAACIGADAVQVVSLGCGGGQKELALLHALREVRPARPASYLMADVSPSLTLVARAAALGAGMVKSEECVPWVIDLAETADWRQALAAGLRSGVSRVVTFFGMMPNFLPGEVLPQLAGLLDEGDVLLVSANLAPGSDYAAGVQQVLPLYDNALTAEWLFSVLADLGVARADGRMAFQVVPCPQHSGLLRIEGNFTFARESSVWHAGQEHRFLAGEQFGLFYSYRHTPAQVQKLFAAEGLALRGQWLNAAADEGVFLLQRKPECTT